VLLAVVTVSGNAAHTGKQAPGCELITATGLCGMNFYAVLGIPRNADDEAIRHAYRILVRRYHPDQGGGSSAQKFQEVKEAYDTLINPASRRAYDFSLQQTTPPIRIQPIVEQSQRFHQEDPSVFGRFAPRVKPSPFASFEEELDNWFRSLDSFFEAEWPW
jgi:curved DNA-binding protein CbpA